MDNVEMEFIFILLICLLFIWLTCTVQVDGLITTSSTGKPCR